jgi:4-hydroxythreonine-4-phosphate dehydrogenase
VDARAGQAAYDALVAATNLALAGAVDAVVTAPLSKAALHMAGRDYPGHTEVLAEKCRSDRVAMMLYLPPRHGVGGRAGLGVVHATLHVALRDALLQLTADRIVECCLLAREGMRGLGASQPRICVCAVNPHAGEGGLFGDEESRLIIPAVASAQADGYNAMGPLPADTALVRARRGEFDAVVAMYHDQGHIALKLLGMHEAVNVTLGLPIIRTSPAHGTAMDIAGKCVAESSGMVAAIETAALLAPSNAP